MGIPKVAVIGYGFAGRCFHSYLIGLAPNLSLHGVASRDASVRARIVDERGCRAYESFERVLDDPEIDLVVIATPNSTHADLAVAALSAGKHVVSDKVMCLSLSDCDRMLDAAASADRLLTVFQNRRFDGDFLTVQKLIADGELGDVRYVELAWQGFGAWGGWRGLASMGGGRFWDLGAHLVDQALMLFPQKIERVYARIDRSYESSDIDSEALIVIAFDNGATAVCDLSGRSAIGKPRFRVHGSKATFIKFGLDPQEKAMIAGDIDSAVEPEENYGRIHDGKSERVVPTLPGRWRNFYENVGNTLAKKPSLIATPHEMRRAMAVLDAAIESARTGDAVRIDA